MDTLGGGTIEIGGGIGLLTFPSDFDRDNCDVFNSSEFLSVGASAEEVDFTSAPVSSFWRM
jgi:hypothetical protein